MIFVVSRHGDSPLCDRCLRVVQEIFDGRHAARMMDAEGSSPAPSHDPAEGPGCPRSAGLRERVSEDHCLFDTSSLLQCADSNPPFCEAHRSHSIQSLPLVFLKCNLKLRHVSAFQIQQQSLF